MDEKRYSTFSFMLSFSSSAICSLLYTMLLLALLGMLSKESTLLQQTGLSPVSAVLWGWIPGLAVAIIAYTIVRIMEDRLTKITGLIIGSFVILAPILSPIIEVLLIFLLTSHGNH